ncbi:related to coenzyme a synthetase [Phialocephala subalpina]|uniref:Related to coenzyme a synthetase n=1 Tax=Phialocephala subalpina TaxID=576137 RepID=A0A1L7WTZ1_9HELO|nr:related to coenzyme a synthetase [Phialocephala subalpina]
MAGSRRDVLPVRSYLTEEELVLYDSWIQFNLELENAPLENFQEHLASIPIISYPSYLPAVCFFALLDGFIEHWSALDVINGYTLIWSTLPEAAKIAQESDATFFAKQLEKQVARSIKDPSSLFHHSDMPALIDPTTRRVLSHNQLSTFIRDFKLPLQIESSLAKRATIVLALPNGYVLGLACLAVACHYTAAPINISGGARQFQTDVELVKPQAIMVLGQDVEKLGLNTAWVTKSRIQLLVVDETSNSTFTIQSPKNLPENGLFNSSFITRADVALILLTSGTSGTKKVVPLTTLSLMTGISCVIQSWGLSSQDTCINMMPLNHVGGLVRNLFAPVLSRGSTILCPSFDPNLFWDLLQDGHGTWYYASPSMHTSILAETEFRESSLANSKLRLICNAAGALLPALAARLKDTFNCTVLPSYGMTECMPISTPPLDYNLDRPGTSGISCGPEMTIMDDEDRPLPADKTGRICVRGGPTFAGYLQSSEITSSTLSKNGWFDTGDLGYIDADGYLYLTGRGKEVINRGGEIISPFEVEEAITIASQTPESCLYHRVRAVLAFSAPHEVLQEVVGVVIVPYLEHPRPDLRALQSALKTMLHPSKVPVAIVYMDGLPVSNNKLLRIKLGERLGLRPLQENMKLLDKHRFAVCPPVNTSLEKKIWSTPCSIDTQLIGKKACEKLSPDFEVYVHVKQQDGLSEVFIAPLTNVLPTPQMSGMVQKHLYESLDGFQIPSNIFLLETLIPIDNYGFADEDELRRLLKGAKAANSDTTLSDTERAIKEAISNVLGVPSENIQPDSDFFDLGGDSLSAGRLLSTLRRDLEVRIPVDQLFAASTVAALAALVDSILSERKSAMPTFVSSQETPEDPGTTYSSTRPALLIIHLLPIILFYPLKMAFQWTMLMYSLSTISTYWKDPHIEARFLSLIAAMAISRLSTQIAAPIMGIVLKWVIIGRFKPGMYPMWGMYHTRWWLVDKILLVCGKGVFRHLHSTRVLYYRALGAKIGHGVKIEKGTTLGEYDLLDIGDNVHLDRCICRPFACERNTTMLLGNIGLGRNCSVGLKAHIAAGSTIPENTYIGPNSSSHEMDDAMQDNGGTIQRKQPQPSALFQLFVIVPVQLVVLFVSSLPWMAALVGIVSNQPSITTDGVTTIINWWATPQRIFFHYLAQTFDAVLRPAVRFAAVVTIKRFLDAVRKTRGASKVDPHSQADPVKTALMDALQPTRSMHSVTKLFGTHYEATSMAVRALGGKVGKRVYWPGTGPSIQDYDMVEIGNDVVFGSRSHLITCDGLGSAPIKIEDGAMIADRVILNPGTVVGRRAVLGSGAVTKREQICGPDTVWVGNKGGSAVCLSQPRVSDEKPPESAFNPKFPPHVGDSLSGKREVQPSQASLHTFYTSTSMDDTRVSFVTSNKPNITSSTSTSTSTSTPFGRAFYGHKAPFFVLGQFTIFVYSSTIIVFTQLFWNTGTISSIILSRILNTLDVLNPGPSRPFVIYGLTAAFLSAIIAFLSISSLLMVITAKWILLGRRKPGNYDWDKSSYCQRWQLFLTIESIRRRCLGGYGVLGMITGTHWIILYFRALGANIGKDCALFAGGRPSLVFTEPDLLDIGDRVAIDDASLVGHINSTLAALPDYRVDPSPLSRWLRRPRHDHWHTLDHPLFPSFGS